MALSAVLHLHTSLPHHAHWLEPFARGMERHGVRTRFVRGYRHEPCDVAVVWGVAGERAEIIAKQRAVGGRTVVLERGFIGDRIALWTAAGFDGLNNHADFCLHEDMPADRVPLLDVTLKPWKRDGRYALLLGQVPGDMSLTGCGNYRAWLDNAADMLARKTGLPVAFRPHPLAEQRGQRIRPHGAILSDGTLDDALSRASMAAAWNSNALVDAVLAGVPVWAADERSMAWSVASRDPALRAYPDREQWLCRMSYCQWTFAEFADGTTWEHLKDGAERSAHAA